MIHRQYGTLDLIEVWVYQEFIVVEIYSGVGTL